MITAKEAAEEYRAELANLTRNDKIQINLLTILAQDYASYAGEIVKVIEDTLYKAPTALKIIILYVVDSIIKNVPIQCGYRELFAKNITDMVVHVFKECTEETRASIYRLRSTWGGIFPNARLYMIDIKLNSIDKAWPIQNPTKESKVETTVLPFSPATQTSTSGHVVHVNPRFLNSTAATTSQQRQQKQQTVVEPPKTTKSIIKKELIDEVSTVTSTTPELEHNTLVVTIKNNTTKTPNSPIKPAIKAEKSGEQQKEKKVVTDKNKKEDKKSISKEEKKEKPTNINKEVGAKKAEAGTAKVETTKVVKKASNNEKTAFEQQRAVESEKDRQQKPTKKLIVRAEQSQEKKQTLERKQPSSEEPLAKKSRLEFGRIPKKRTTATISSRVEQEQLKKGMAKPESLLSLKVRPPTTMAPQQQKQQQQVVQTTSAHKRSRFQKLQAQMQQQQQQQSQHGGFQHQSTKSSLPVPTAALGAHAFGQNVLLAAVASTTTTTSTIRAQTPPQAQPPSCVMEATTAVGMMMDTQFQQTQHEQQQQQRQHQSQQLAGTEFVDQQQQSMSMGSSAFKMQMQQIFTEPKQQIPMGPSVNEFSVIPPQHNIQNVTVRLPGVQENNRIFVDGKAYEVFFLDEVAVIERNGLPHRVSFAGPPRDVIIDGCAYRMAFGEHKQVLIDGDLHVLHFGAPSRELYMGNFPFKGTFGGAPIVATINGRRHELRLCGPPPEVRIDPEPSYELMRHMPAIREQQQQTPKVSTKEESILDVNSLLKRLKSSGLLTQLSEPERKNRERQAAIEAKSAVIGRANLPPIPCSHRLDNEVERRAAPVAALHQFSMRALNIRYDSVIDAIHQQRKTCQHCGIAFDELYGPAYQQHMDWHLRETLNIKDPGHKYMRSQPWYMPDEWFNYSETELVNKAAQNEPDTDGTTGLDGSNNEMGASPKHAQSTDGTMQDPTSDLIENKECQVCNEQFEEYWDEDEEVWRLRNCVLLGGKAFHVYCQDDAADPQLTVT